jgi:Zn-dependent M16 (insulinase) family peptidase
LSKKPFSTPIEPLTKSHEEVVFFPCDEEKSSNGIVSIGWRGPHISDLEELFAIDILFAYLTESSISPLQSYFIQKNSLCSRVNYTIEEYKETFVMLSFINAQIDHLHGLKDKLDEILNNLFERKIELDLKRLTSIIQMKIFELRDKFEDHPHDTVSKLCIGDFLYGDDNELAFTQRLQQAEILQKLKDERDEYWLRVIERWFYKTNTVTIIAKPSEELSRKIGEEDKQRVNERKTRLGKKGLRELEDKLQNAIDQNDVCIKMSL